MADKTSIEWAANADGTPGATWNPIRARDTITGKIGTHCVHASTGCVNCYAERHNMRGMTPGGTGLAYTKQNEARVEIFLNEKMLLKPLLLNPPTTFFLSSMSDIAADFVPDWMLDRLFTVMACCPQHTFIILTKRAERLRAYMEAIFATKAAPRGFHCPPWPALLNRVESEWLNHDPHDYMERIRPLMQRGIAGRAPLPDGPLPNVWIGTSVEDRANIGRIWDTIHTPAARHVISFEPLLEDVADKMGDVWRPGDTIDGAKPCIDWVIVGGESGPGARPMNPQWARNLRDLFVPAGVAFFFKQWGEWLDATGPAGPVRVGKAKSGRVLDGRTHDDRPPFSHLERNAA